MAYSITEQSGQATYNKVEYVVNTDADVASVPTDAASGSTIMVISSGSVYMLSVVEGGVKTWTLVGG